MALAVGLLVTAALALAARVLYDHNEQRLLKLRVRELGLVLAATAPSIQTPLASADALASATNGSPAKFRAFLAPYVGPKRQFQSVSLWRLGAAHPTPLAVVGAPPRLASMPRRAALVLAPTAKARVLTVTGVIDEAHPKLGFEIASGTKRATTRCTRRTRSRRIVARASKATARSRTSTTRCTSGEGSARPPCS